MDEDVSKESWRSIAVPLVAGIHRMMVDFNRGYTGLLGTLQTAFDGSPELLRDAIPMMYELKYQAQALMRIPSGRDDGTTVGPGFSSTG